jgi:hypothetical protein
VAGGKQAAGSGAGDRVGQNDRPRGECEGWDASRARARTSLALFAWRWWGGRPWERAMRAVHGGRARCWRGGHGVGWANGKGQCGAIPSNQPTPAWLDGRGGPCPCSLYHTRLEAGIPIAVGWYPRSSLQSQQTTFGDSEIS